MLLEVMALNKAFGGLQAVRDASFGVEANKVTGLVGPNGAGKTTVFNMITGTLSADSGQVLLEGKDITSMSAQDRVGLGIARTFQDVRLLPRLSVVDNVCVGVQGHPGEKLAHVLLFPLGVGRSERAARDKAREALSFVGIDHDRWDLSAASLSYGEQKLVSIARLLATDAQVLLLDEPTSGLDEGSLDQFRAVLRRLIDDGRTVVTVEHNMLLVRELCDIAVFLANGEVLDVDIPARLMEKEELRNVYFGA
jgi:ABC-type branched-subunit amino acid transport system ATPase component